MEPGYVQRWIVIHKRSGQPAQARQGRNTYATEQEARQWIAEVLKGTDADTVAQLFPTGLAVALWYCYEGHHDPAQPVNRNPFTVKAAAARAKADQMRAANEQEGTAMREAFPRGGGYGRPGAEKRIGRTVERAVNATAAEREAQRLETLQELFNEGKVNAQGRTIRPDAQQRTAKRKEQEEARRQKQENARAAIEGKQPHEITPEQWADACGYFAGSARELVMEEHRQRTRK